MANTEIKCEIKEKYGVISETGNKGWTREVNLVSWNDGEEKIDIRAWSPGHDKNSKFASITKEEAKALRDILNNMNLD